MQTTLVIPEMDFLASTPGCAFSLLPGRPTGCSEEGLLAFLLLRAAEMIAAACWSVCAMEEGNKQAVQFCRLVLKPGRCPPLQTPPGLGRPGAAAVTLPLSRLYSLENWKCQFDQSAGTKAEMSVLVWLLGPSCGSLCSSPASPDLRTGRFTGACIALGSFHMMITASSPEVPAPT